MIKNILLHYPEESSSAKLYFPQYILEHLNWNVDTPLLIKELTETSGIYQVHYGFGITIQRNMNKSRISAYLSTAPFYNALFLYVYKIKNIEHTLPISCSHLISSASYPPKLNIMIPQDLKMFHYESMFEDYL